MLLLLKLAIIMIIFVVYFVLCDEISMIYLKHEYEPLKINEILK